MSASRSPDPVIITVTAQALALLGCFLEDLGMQKTRKSDIGRSFAEAVRRVHYVLPFNYPCRHAVHSSFDCMLLVHVCWCVVGGHLEGQQRERGDEFFVRRGDGTRVPRCRRQGPERGRSGQETV